ncbi:PAS domain S-box protein [Pseudoduganella sp. DS3]|uniref:histidine kinase n=1 Tax=Pseudoduganella guangdongensis TaxID=2692179 RepID=A0A6N9HC08_9BURK|nr:PAS domain-containing sensor histidine kinase [Pseudoduganella guangdongensis]MYN01034.1 PAS domain S-box protein [Pseudoduganella guangdongensis]
MLSAEHYRQILDHSSDVHWMLDCDSGQLLYVSPAAEKLFGYVPERAQQVAQHLMAELPQRLEAYTSGDTTRRHTVRDTEMPGKDGVLIPVEIESTLVPDVDSGVLRLVGTVRDIRERVERERQQKKFASMVSHEFRTPLSTIDGAIQRLEMTSQNADENTKKRYRKIQTSVDRLLELINEYLSPERLASIGRKRQADEVSPEALLETAAEQARQRRADITVRADGLPQWMRCDPQGLRLCLDILLDNALKYTNDNVAIELHGRKASEGGVELLVIDRGAPVPDDELGKLFDKGYRGKAAAGHAGSGLGLYMAKNVIEVHGGSLSVENLPESGKKFRIWLPVAA